MARIKSRTRYVPYRPAAGLGTCFGTALKQSRGVQNSNPHVGKRYLPPNQGPADLRVSQWIEESAGTSSVPTSDTGITAMGLPPRATVYTLLQTPPDTLGIQKPTRQQSRGSAAALPCSMAEVV